MPDSVSWQNRIIGSGTERPDQLLANPRNFRRHPREQQSALRGVLSEVGWVQDVIVNQQTGFLVDGHLRVELAMREGQTDVPVKYVDLSPDEEALVLASLDPIAALATADADALTALLADVQSDNTDVLTFIDDLRDRHGIGLGGSGLVDPDDVPEPPDEPVTKPGDLWLLGEHRLLCGDATSEADVRLVLGGQSVEMVWTDPPYGVAIGDKNRFLNSIAPSNRVEENLQNDTLSEPALLDMLRQAFSVAAKSCTAGAAWYVAAPAVPLHIGFGQILKDMGIYRQTLIWVKQNATFAPLGVDYHWRHEPIFYGWLPNAAHRSYGDRKQDTVWEIDRPQASPEHPTMKPVELVTRAIGNSSRTGDIVLDPFLGSGTTLIAAEQLGRRCYGLEIEPKYCDVIVRRWEQFTGQTASRERAEDAA